MKPFSILDHVTTWEKMELKYTFEKCHRFGNANISQHIHNLHIRNFIKLFHGKFWCSGPNFRTWQFWRRRSPGIKIVFLLRTRSLFYVHFSLTPGSAPSKAINLATNKVVEFVDVMQVLDMWNHLWTLCTFMYL